MDDILKQIAVVLADYSILIDKLDYTLDSVAISNMEKSLDEIAGRVTHLQHKIYTLDQKQLTEKIYAGIIPPSD